jgi:hypothetical protein
MLLSNNEKHKLSNSNMGYWTKIWEMYPIHHVELVNVTNFCKCVPSQNILNSKWLKRNLWPLNATRHTSKKFR